MHDILHYPLVIYYKTIFISAAFKKNSDSLKSDNIFNLCTNQMHNYRETLLAVSRIYLTFGHNCGIGHIKRVVPGLTVKQK